MAEKINIDLWHYTTPTGKSLKKGFDFLYPYISKEKPWPGRQIKDFDFEEAYGILTAASKKYNCKKCRGVICQLAGEKAKELRLSLLI